MATLPQLCLKSTQSFIINVQLDNSPAVLPALVNSGASSTFVSNQLDLSYDTLDKPLELQLFNGSPALTGVIQYHDSTLTLDNRLRFQVQLLITQLLESTLIVLGLPWLQDINPNIDWKDLSTQFLGPKASLTAAIPLCLQPPSNSNIPDLDSSSSRVTQIPTTLKDNQEREESAPLPQSPLNKPQWLPPTFPGIDTKACSTLTNNTSKPCLKGTNPHGSHLNSKFHSKWKFDSNQLTWQ
ncbi:hypothetical protein C0989_010809 [Termitomyces sp. Mn162]|nr:hypothetical protein C0989_010809 [Termitomyces sp. Mn162]